MTGQGSPIQPNDKVLIMKEVYIVTCPNLEGKLNDHWVFRTEHLAEEYYGLMARCFGRDMEGMHIIKGHILSEKSFDDMKKRLT